jgi:WD40 repeat protein
MSPSAPGASLRGKIGLLQVGHATAQQHAEADLSFPGSDDFQMRVYNYNTSEKVTSFEAHPDYIRAIAVHPTQPFVLTASVGSSLQGRRKLADVVT